MNDVDIQKFVTVRRDEDGCITPTYSLDPEHAELTEIDFRDVRPSQFLTPDPTKDPAERKQRLKKIAEFLESYDTDKTKIKPITVFTPHGEHGGFYFLADSRDLYDAIRIHHASPGRILALVYAGGEFDADLYSQTKAAKMQNPIETDL